MKKLISILLIMIFALSSVPAIATEEEYDPQHTMLALNMAIVSIHRILTTQDRIVLEQEYQNIINNLSLGNIESDYDLTALYQDLMSLITRKRLRDEEAKIFQSRYDRREQNLLMDTLSGVRAYGGNLYSWLESLAVSCVSSYFSYQDSKAELAEGLEGDLWLLKKEDIENCNELQERLLNSSWNLLRQYKLPDNYRLVQKVTDDFYRAVNEKDSKRRLRMLRALEKDFQVYPPYWFYRAKAAQESKDDKEAHLSFMKFNEVWRPVLRQDPYKVEAAKFRISELAKNGKLTDTDKKEALELLEVMRNNTPRDDWANNLFAGIAYFMLDEKDTGIETVETNVDFGYEKTLSNALIAEMKNGQLDALTLYALKDDIRDMFEKTQTKQVSSKRRNLTEEDIIKITTKYDFSFNIIRALASEGFQKFYKLPAGKYVITHSIWPRMCFCDDKFYWISSTYESIESMSYDELRNNPKITYIYLKELCKDYSSNVAYGIVSMLMELKELE